METNELNTKLLKELRDFFRNPQGEHVIQLLSDIYLMRSSFNIDPLKMAYNEGFKGFILFLKDILEEETEKENKEKSMIEDLFGED